MAEGNRMSAVQQPRWLSPADTLRQIHLVGVFELVVDDIPVALPMKGQRLAAFLALRGRTTRSHLAGALWPDVQHPLGNLRTTIWRINTLAPGLVVVHGGVVDLSPNATVDVHQVMKTARVLLDNGPDPGPDEVAMAVDPSDLLPDWDDEWLLTDRERLRQLRLHMCEAVAERLFRSGRHGLALDAALSALSADPLRESAYRLVIRIHLAEGNLAVAQQAYADCTRVLLREIGVRPSFRFEEFAIHE